MPNTPARSLCRHAAALLFSLLLLPGCGSNLPDVESIETPAEFTEAMKQCMDEFVATMDEVEDMDSFEANKEDLTATLNCIGDLMQKAEDMKNDEISAAEAEKLQQDLRDYGESLNEKMQEIKTRLENNPELAKAIRDHMSEVMENHPYTIQQEKEMQQRFAERISQEQERFDQEVAEFQGELPVPGDRPNVRDSPELKTVTVVVQDVVNSQQSSRILSELTRASQGKPVRPLDSPTQRTQRFEVRYITDLAAFANRITFGQVLSTDQATNTITVRYTE